VGEQIRREERSWHLSVIPLRRDIPIQELLIGVRVQVHPVGVAPNVNVAAVRDRLIRVDLPLHSPPQKSHWRAEHNPLGEMKDFLIERIIVWWDIPQDEALFPEMHRKIS